LIGGATADSIVPMNKFRKILALSASLVASPSLYAAPVPADAYSIVADLTTEVGQRLAGTDREAAARDWAVARLKALGFAKVHVETFPIPGWERGEEKAMISAPVPQKLAVTALGHSGATPAGGVSGELVYFPTLDALKAAPDGSLKGKIAFVDHAFKAAQDGAGYGPFGQPRRIGPIIAAQKGASALLIRSAGTDHTRDPHTGVTNAPKEGAPLPAGAVSGTDADLVARLAARGQVMRVAVTLTPRFTGTVTSGNVIADLPGKDPSLAPILVGCHLDSWDLGTGAIDDASGCAIVTAAALQASKDGQLARSIRLLWAGSEEIGGFGGQDYAKTHAKEPHALVMESDSGADRVYAVEMAFAPADKALADKLGSELARMGITQSQGHPEGGEDVGYTAVSQKTAVIDLKQDATRYFDWHHTPSDTLERIDPVQLQQNVDAWAVVLKILGNETKVIGKLP